MNITAHFQTAWRPAAAHLMASALVLGCAAAMVFLVWYPSPLDQLADGRAILLIVMAVDLACGPLLTFLIASPGKSRLAFFGDVAVIGVLQLAALTYGVISLYDARPVYLAFEGNRFRVVSVPDIDPTSRATGEMAHQPLPMWGPVPIGVKILESNHPEYLQSLQQALEGNHPAFRPERWVPYEQQASQVKAASRPVDDLIAQSAQTSSMVLNWLATQGKSSSQVRFLPLENEKKLDWVILLDSQTTMPLGYLALDGWR